MPRTLEWKYLVGFAAGILAWLFLGVPFLNGLTVTYSVLLTFPAFLLGYGLLFYVLGQGMSDGQGRKFALVFVSVFLLTDVASPPILVPLSGPTQLSPEQSLASDVFFYTLFAHVLALPHPTAWLLTYVGVPLVSLFVVIYELSGSRLKHAVFGG